MITNWQEFEEWVRKSNLNRWVIANSNNYKTTGEGGEPNGVKIVDSDFYGDDLDNKLAMTKTVLSRQNGRFYAYGWQGQKRSGGICEEVCFNGVFNNGINGIGATWAQPQPAQTPVDEKAIEERLRKQIMAEIDRKQYEKDRKALDDDKREFEKEKAGVWGLAINYLKPLVDVTTAARNGGVMPRVAGLPSAAEPGTDEPQTQEPEESDDFTDEEAQELKDLIVRFKTVEPKYLQLLRTVVEMAESGDTQYSFARKFLIKE